jgi:hypothetical protein
MIFPSTKELNEIFQQFKSFAGQGEPNALLTPQI